jgi:hypothetical protein
MKLLDLYNNVTVRQGEGLTSELIAATDMTSGQCILDFSNLKTTLVPLYTTVQVDTELHVDTTQVPLRYMNHSCDPNCIVDTTNKVVVTLKAIGVGEAITFFYPSTEWDMAQPFACWCGSTQCVKVVKGAKYLPRATIRSGEWFFNKHILDME